MKNVILYSLILFFLNSKTHSQNAGQVAAGVAGLAAITYLAIETDKKTIAKEISQFRSKEYIINHIIGDSNGKEIQFETEALASDNSGGLITVAFNCNEVNKSGLLLAFFGENRNEFGVLIQAYAFRYIPLAQAKELFIMIDETQERNKKYMSSENDVNNVYMEFEDIKFVIYKDGGEQIRVFWNGFQVIWERAPFDRSKRRLEKWFD